MATACRCLIVLIEPLTVGGAEFGLECFVIGEGVVEHTAAGSQERVVRLRQAKESLPHTQRVILLGKLLGKTGMGDGASIADLQLDRGEAVGTLDGSGNQLVE